MDVTCERCGTEYEFDETLISDRGTTVKCTNCGHLFKVFRPGAEASGGPETRAWTLETATGTQQIASLKELQRLITAGEVSAEDRISRAGEGWKKLGDIAELSTFFAAARPKSVRPPPRRDPTPVRAAPAPAPPPAPHPPAPPPRKGTMMGLGGQPQREAVDVTARTLEMAVAPPAQPHPPPRPPAGVQTVRGNPPPSTEEIPAPPRRPASVRPPPTREAPLPPPPDPADSQEVAQPSGQREPSQRMQKPAAQRSGRASERTAEARPSNRPRGLQYDDDDDVPPPVPTRSYTGVFLGIVVVAALGIGGYFGRDAIQRMIQGTPAEAPGAQFLAAGDSALARDRDDAYEDAAEQYTKALALDEHNARVLTGLSRAHALLAQSHLFEAADLEARAATDPTSAGEAAVLRRQAAAEAEHAREHAEVAVRQADGGADAEVALSDALRLSGEAALASSRLDRALTLAPTPSAEALRVRAMLSADQSGLAAAADDAERAVAEDPGLLRARLLLARAQLAAGNVSAARAQVGAVLDRDAQHPVALALRTRIEQAGPAVDGGVAAPPSTVPSTTVPPSAVPPTTVATEEPETEEGDDHEGSGGGGGGGTPHGDYDALVHQGSDLLERGSASRARPLFEAALRQRPTGSEALTGMGFVLLDAGNASQAVTYFRQASSAGYGHAFIGLGSAYRQMHDYDHALEAYEGYLARLPSGPESSIARRQADLLRAQGAHGSTGGGSTAPPPPPPPSHTEEPAPESDTPVTHESHLPAPRDHEGPAPSDVPALDSEP